MGFGGFPFERFEAETSLLLFSIIENKDRVNRPTGDEGSRIRGQIPIRQ
jgi:hypothetical protein